LFANALIPIGEEVVQLVGFPANLARELLEPSLENSYNGEYVPFPLDG